MRRFVVTLAIMSFPISSWADSWCGYNANLIGTKAVSYRFPTDREIDLANRTCRIRVQNEPAKDIPVTEIACSELQSIDNPCCPSDANGFADEYDQHSEYFAILTFGVRNGMNEVRTNQGLSLWTGQYSESVTIVYDDPEDRRYAKIGAGGSSSADIFYAAPDFSAEQLDPPTPHGATQQDFFERFYPDLTITPRIVDALVTYEGKQVFRDQQYADRHQSRQPDPLPEDLQALYDLKYWDDQDFFGYDYVVLERLERDDGSVWDRAHEKLSVDPVRNVSDEVLRVISPNASGTYSSDPIREVFIPIRDKDGTILNVYLGGPYCD